MSDSSNTTSCLLEKEALGIGQAYNSSVSSIQLVQSDGICETIEYDQVNKEPRADNIIIACCHGEKSCVTNSSSDINMGEDTIENDYNDMQTMLPTISLTYSDNNTNNNKLENNNNNNDTGFDSNPSDSHCAYIYAYNDEYKETTATN